MRKFAYHMLTNDEPLGLLVPPTRVFSSGAADSPAKPFIVVRSLATLKPMRESVVEQGGWQINIHDEPSSYTGIDDIQDAINVIMDSVEPQWYQGRWLMDLVNNGWSEDLFDDHYQTATRYGTFGWTARR